MMYMCTLGVSWDVRSVKPLVLQSDILYVLDFAGVSSFLRVSKSAHLHFTV